MRDQDLLSLYGQYLSILRCPFRYYFFLYVKDQKLETSFFSFFSYEVVYNNLNRTSLGWAYLHP